jgi:predicted metalloprotease
MRSVLVAIWVVCSLVLVPAGVRAQSTVELIAEDLNAWWTTQFEERGLTYSPPRLEEVSFPGAEICGGVDAYYTPAGYCPLSDTVTYSTAFGGSGDLFWLPILSHEWGHHIQNLTDTGISSALESELQADCFSGAFVAFAQGSDRVSPLISALSLQLTQSAGDVWWAMPGEESIHGTSADRAIAFMAGLNGGLASCGI